MRGPLIQSRAGRYTWLQVLALVLSGIAYVMGSLPTALVLLTLGTVFGVVAMVIRVREAQRINQQTARNRRRR